MPSTEAIADFLARRGMKVFRTQNCWWYNEYRQERIYQAFPFHQPVTPNGEEIRELFSKAPKAFAARFLSPWEGPGLPTGLWVCQGPYDMSRLRSKSRNQTRRGLENCEVRKVPWAELVEKGWEAHRDTTERHGDGVPGSLGFDVGLEECAAYEAWGAFVGVQLAAYLVTMVVEDWATIQIARSANAYLKSCPNNALVFRATSELLARPGISAVTYGVDSLIGRESLAHFKTGMGYVQVPIRQRVVVRPLLKPFFNSAVCWMAERITQLPKLKRSNRMQKVAGFCRAIRASSTSAGQSVSEGKSAPEASG